MGKRNVTVILYPGDDGRYTAFTPLLRGCTTQGDSPQHALQMAKESIELMLEEATEDDIESLEMSWAPHVVVGDVEVEVPARYEDTAKRSMADLSTG
jgi:predicted RNase H-like HicB family nuclease